MFTDKQTLILIIFLLLEIFLTATLFSEEYVYGQWQKEESYQISEFGKETVERIKKESGNVYSMMFIKTGFAQGVVNLFVPSKDQRENTKGMENFGSTVFNYASNRMVLFWDGIYQAIYRLFLMLEYLPLILPLLIPAIVDGLMQREVKKRNYGYASSIRFTFSIQVIFILLLLVPIYLFIPLAVSPKIVLICGYVMVFLSIIMASNLQKQI